MKGRSGNHPHSHPKHRPHLHKPASKHRGGKAGEGKEVGGVEGKKQTERLDRHSRAAFKNGGAANFIDHAIKRPGALTKKAEHAGKSIFEFAKEHEHSKGLAGEESRFYENVLKKTHKPKK